MSKRQYERKFLDTLNECLVYGIGLRELKEFEYKGEFTDDELDFIIRYLYYPTEFDIEDSFKDDYLLALNIFIKLHNIYNVLDESITVKRVNKDLNIFLKGCKEFINDDILEKIKEYQNEVE